MSRQSEYNRRLRERYRSEGRCRDCGADSTRYRCEPCREKAAEYARNRRARARS